MARKWQAISWSRELPKPVRNGRFYRIGHAIAVVLAGHAHNDGTGITVTLKTVAEETWCTLKEVQEAMGWLEDEKWFSRQQGPKGLEWACNFEITRGDGSDVEDRLERKRAQGRERARRHAENKKKKDGSDCVSKVREDALEGCVREDPPLTQVTNALTHPSNAPNAPFSRNSVSGRVRTAGHSSTTPLNSHEDPKEDPTTCTVPVQSEAEQGAMFATPSPPPGPRSLDYSADLETFWSAWRAHNPKDPSGTPKRPVSGKGAAAKALPAALRRANLDTILNAIPAYMASEKPQRGFIKDASTWLNNRGWDDEYTPHRPQQANGFTPPSFDQTDYHDTGGFGA